ncbi:glycerophosphoryl diester phosphodiesterase membrane domain-containing protein [Streptomyces sp. NBC_00557]|uniref:glycerophosphoryl diester phosphodiesterase membrane domain-containing protein n=1 Tax=Streptomyces sp. NBC_00557 TaxID=2975776 RepID=UPI002E81E70B|nr:glycerophosphoryl diester phosphodiesterase membrane domain-containing protein [Streptomyces sp. NBC_00557]WUC36611.1 glycerophosphoryl diester phosphodiesterase membrane domain-containing protein [Streptomyces sp. NBC_00557]
MTDTPGWASPGTAPSNEGREPGTSGPAEPADRPGDTAPAPQQDPHAQGPGVKWSKEQPPPGQWSAPTGAPSPQQAPPPPPPGPGWTGQPHGQAGHGGYAGPQGGYGGPPPGYGAPGGYGAWGGGWGGPPPAAKPGVIPLRPLAVGEILDGAVSTMRTHWRTVLGISLAVALLLDTSTVLLQGLVLNDTAVQSTLKDPGASPDEVFRALREMMIGTGIVSVIRAVAVIIATALLTTITSRAVLGRAVGAREAWRESRPQIPRLFGLLILLALIFTGIAVGGALPGIVLLVAGSTAGGAALLVLGLLAAAVVVVWLGIRFYLAAPALMLERQGVVKSMRRSAKLVRGSWWRTFGIVLLTLLLTGMVSAVITIPFTAFGAAVSGDGMNSLLTAGGGHTSWATLIIQGIGALIGTTLTLPISAGVTVLLYIDQRIRREALDLELARAAGVHGTAGPGAVQGS